jgi:hypothetical protein
MPRTSKKATQPNALVASAARVVAGRRKNRPTSVSAWQTEVWTMLDTVGELGFYHGWIVNALSQCTLSVVEDLGDDAGGETPATDPLVLAAMGALFGGDAGQGEMLGTMGGHLALPGETWLCGLLEPPADPEIDMWRVLSHEEVKEQGNRWMIDRGDGEPETYSRDQVYITRIWQPHPRKWVEANSSVRSALPILRQMVGLSKRDAANIDSRLIGNGILAVPSEITFASPGSPDEDGSDPEQDPFMAALIEAGITAIEDPGSPEALFPLLVKAPAEHLDKIKHLTLATPLDEKSMEQQDRLIKRLANSLDVPAEVLLGLADVNHWTGWLLDENAIKMHVEPLLKVITQGLTTRYLWPILQGDSDALDPSLRRFRVVGSTANLRQRPNRSSEAQGAHDSITITDEAWARETGFQTDDLLTPESPEFRRRVLMRLATTGTPEVVVGAMAALGVEMDLPTPPAVETGPTVPGEVAPPAPPAPTDTRNDRALPQQDQTLQAAALLASAEVVVQTAVTRAWNRAGKRGRTRGPVPAGDLDAAMAGVWDGVPRVAALLGVEPEALRTTLDGYARALLTTGAEHDPRALATALVPLVTRSLPASA